MDGLFGDDGTLVPAFETADIRAAAGGLAAATLNLWVDAGWVQPSLAPGVGKRVQRYWSAQDLVTVRAVSALRSAGCQSELVIEVDAWIRAAWVVDWPDHLLVWDGASLSLMRARDLAGVIDAPERRVVRVVSMPIGAWRADAMRRAVEIDLETLRTGRRARAPRVPKVRPTASSRHAGTPDVALPFPDTSSR